VNDVLDYSKLETGNVDIDIHKSNLQEILNSVVRSIETEGQSKKLLIDTEYDAALPKFVQTDSCRLQQILYNLLGNAVKFSKERGVVELAVHLTSCTQQGGTTCAGDQSSPEENGDHNSASSQCPLHRSPVGNGSATRESPVESGCPFSRSARPCESDQLKEEQFIRIIVKDYGKGIKQEDFAKIFQPFLQAGVETEREYGGTGLGLAITSKLVDALGGTISVDSEEGKWSQFTVNLPFHGTQVDAAGMSAKLKDTTIFLVENEERSILAALRIFRQYGVQVAPYTTMKDLEAAIIKNGLLLRDRSYICLVHEELYQKESYALLSGLSRCALVTFGPKYAVKGAVGHFRSLAQVLPSVLMQSMISFVNSMEMPSKSSSMRPLAEALGSRVPYRDIRVLIAEGEFICALFDCHNVCGCF
jgi:hypothetical protein